LHDHLVKKCSNSEEERNVTSGTPILDAPTTTIFDPPFIPSIVQGWRKHFSFSEARYVYSYVYAEASK